MTGRDGQRGQVIIEAVGILPIAALSALLMVDSGIYMADRLAITRVAGAVAVDSRGDDAAEISQRARKAAPSRLTKSVHARTVEGQLVVSARPRTLLLGRVTNLSVSSSVELPDSPEVQAS